jgi:hypothetical protein
MKRSAAAYKRKDKVLFHADSKTTMGVLIATPPFIAIDADSTEDLLATTLLKVLAFSREGIPHPTDWSSIQRPILDLARVKSWSTFCRGSLCCDVDEEGDVLTITPTINMGKDGFLPLKERQVEVFLGATSSEIGKALLRAFELSE